jgi:hypothetical protein
LGGSSDATHGKPDFLSEAVAPETHFTGAGEIHEGSGSLVPCRIPT